MSVLIGLDLGITDVVAMENGELQQPSVLKFANVIASYREEKGVAIWAVQVAFLSTTANQQTPQAAMKMQHQSPAFQKVQIHHHLTYLYGKLIIAGK